MQAESTLKRTIVFNGISYNVGLPVNSSLDFKAWRFGYEYNFIYRDRGFIGFILEAKYTDITASLASPFNDDFASAKAPVPAVGLIARGYLAANVALTGELTGIKLPGNIEKLDGNTGEDPGPRRVRHAELHRQLRRAGRLPPPLGRVPRGRGFRRPEAEGLLRQRRGEVLTRRASDATRSS